MKVIARFTIFFKKKFRLRERAGESAGVVAALLLPSRSNRKNKIFSRCDCCLLPGRLKSGFKSHRNFKWDLPGYLIDPTRNVHMKRFHLFGQQ